MRYFKAVTVILVLMTAQSAAAQTIDSPKPLDVRGTYYMTLAGIPVAKIWMAVEGKPDRFVYTASLKSRGMVRWFKKIKSLLVSEGVKTGHGWQALDVNIHSIYPDETNETKLQYSTDGLLLKRVLSHDDDPKYRPLVAEEKLTRISTYGDAFFNIRDLSYQAVRQGKDRFVTQLYDGKRLMEITAKIEGEEVYELHDRPVPTYKLSLSRSYLAGFTEKEAKRYAEGEPPLYLFMRKKDYLPIALEIELAFGSFKALWEQE